MRLALARMARARLQPGQFRADWRMMYWISWAAAGVRGGGPFVAEAAWGAAAGAGAAVAVARRSVIPS